MSAFLCGIIASTAYGCGGIDEPDLFTGGDAGSGSADGGKSDSSTRDSGRVDAGQVVGVGSVQCTGAPTPCSIASNQACCYSLDTSSGTCDVAGNCNGGNEFPIPCDSTQDCADLGQKDTLCCAQADQTGNVTNVECRPPSNCQAAQGQTNLCDPAAANPCPNGGNCTPSTVSLPGYYICVM